MGKGMRIPARQRGETKSQGRVKGPRSAHGTASDAAGPSRLVTGPPHKQGVCSRERIWKSHRGREETKSLARQPGTHSAELWAFAFTLTRPVVGFDEELQDLSLRPAVTIGRSGLHSATVSDTDVSSLAEACLQNTSGVHACFIPCHRECHHTAVSTARHPQ